MIDDNDGEWHGWNGGECPVHGESVVECAWLEDGIYDGGSQLARLFNWDSDVNPIIAFRVTKQHKEPMTIWVAISSGNSIDSSVVKGELEGYGYTDIRKFVEVTE